MQDIVIAGFVIPAVVSAVVSGIWGYLKDRDLARLKGSLERDLEGFKSHLQREQETLKSRLQREQEAFRLVHSPRVTGAVRLWAAFCEFDRSLRQLVVPLRYLNVPKGVTREEEERIREEEWQKQEADLSSRVSNAWNALKVARDEAEVLLPGPVYAMFDDLFKLCMEANNHYRTAQLMSRMANYPGGESLMKVTESIEAADRKRPQVVEAIRKLIAEPLEG